MARHAKLSLAAAFLVVAMIGSSTAGIAQMQSTSSAGRDFATQAAEANQGEIALAKLALQKTSNPAVRMFAQRMITDHSKAATQLASIASSQSITLPSSDMLMAQDQQTQQTLSGLSGHPFDVAYIKSQVADHEAAIALFQKESKDTSDAALMQFASTTLPTLQDHLKLAQQTETNIGP
jgi:putative membrane protein